mmetsp:Transcript_7875/g.14003  ORF Transcript_7875/g.14003 Transcript_7875/m.14003 type:complete len:213 (+) Transcript_7875:479-1117(+)
MGIGLHAGWMCMTAWPTAGDTILNACAWASTVANSTITPIWFSAFTEIRSTVPASFARYEPSMYLSEWLLSWLFAADGSRPVTVMRTVRLRRSASNSGFDSTLEDFPLPALLRLNRPSGEDFSCCGGFEATTGGTAKRELLRPSPAASAPTKGLLGNADRSPPSPPPARDRERGGERPRVWLLCPDRPLLPARPGGALLGARARPPAARGLE